MLTAAFGAGLKSGRPALAIEMMGDYAADVLLLRSNIVQSAVYPLTIVGVTSLLLMLVVVVLLPLPPPPLRSVIFCVDAFFV